VSPLAWLPAASLFALPVADSRAALSSVTLRWEDRFAVDATLGADFPLVRLTHGDWSFDAGVEAAVAMGFQPNENLRFDLETVDGSFGFPFGVRFGAWSGRLEFAHTSAHFADGVLDDPSPPAASEGYSREWARLLVARELGHARAYGGTRFLLHDQRALPPWAFQVGAEITGPWKVAPYAALDVQLAQENEWGPELGGQIGVRAQVTGGQRLRAAAVGRVGPADTGKLQGQRDAWLGIVFGMDSTGALPVNAGVDDAPGGL
jgi:hypothetical protein